MKISNREGYDYDAVIIGSGSGALSRPLTWPEALCTCWSANNTGNRASISRPSREIVSEIVRRRLGRAGA